MFIDRELNQFTELRRRLIEAHPEIDDTTLMDTLQGATNLTEAIAEIIRATLMDEAMLRGLTSRLQDLTTRLDRLRAAVLAKKKVARDAMEEAGIEKIVEPDFTVSLRTAPGGVLITNESEIPEWFWIPQPPKLDRKRILRTLNAGEDVAGVALANSQVTLAIRTK